MSECRLGLKHSKMPTGYLAWHAEAERRGKAGWKQRKCRCGLWAIWTAPKRAKEQAK